MLTCVRNPAATPGAGRRGEALTALHRQRLDETHNGRTIADILVDALIKGALKGSPALLRELPGPWLLLLPQPPAHCARLPVAPVIVSRRPPTRAP